MSKFKVGDRVRGTHSRDVESGIGTVEALAQNSSRVYVRWPDGLGAWMHPGHLTHAPKKPVRMVRVGWYVPHHSPFTLYTRKADAVTICNRECDRYGWPRGTQYPVALYARRSK